MTKILVVDDDRDMVNFIRIELERIGYNVISSFSGDAALKLLEEDVVDLAIVDVMMPGLDGFEVTRVLRHLYDLPVILLTARHHMEDKEQGFLSGSDDYMVKPFEAKELLYRIQAILRRYNKPHETIISVGSIQIDRRSYEIQTTTSTLMLPLKEFEVLSYLASKPNHVFSREQIIERVWGLEFQGDEQTVNVHIKRIRSRLAQHAPDVQITTVRGVGYKLEVPS